MLALGIITGFFISKAIGFNLILQQQSTERSTQLQDDGSLPDGSGAAAVAGFRRGVAGDAVLARARQWPDPSSPQALLLLQDPAGPDGERNISSAAVC
jgi:hypothetical protein